ncbi:MAG: hypothetical protein ACR2O3_07495 [Rhizobiaceae bacterium]
MTEAGKSLDLVYIKSRVFRLLNDIHGKPEWETVRYFLELAYFEIDEMIRIETIMIEYGFSSALRENTKLFTPPFDQAS